MRCPYCGGQVVGDMDVVVLVGQGPAHTLCYERYNISKRVYKDIDFSALAQNDLLEMKEMILTELNARQRSDTDIQNNEIELFG